MSTQILQCLAIVFIQDKPKWSPLFQCHSISGHVKKLHVKQSKWRCHALEGWEWDWFWAILSLRPLWLWGTALEILVTDVSFINCCGRMTLYKMVYCSAFISWENKVCASQPCQMRWRNPLLWDHNGIKDHDIYRADFRNPLGKCTVVFIQSVCLSTSHTLALVQWSKTNQLDVTEYRR